MRLRHLCILIPIALCGVAVAVLWRHAESEPTKRAAEGASREVTEGSAEPSRQAPDGSAEASAEAIDRSGEAAEGPEGVAEEAGAAEARAELERGLEFRKQGRFDTAIVIFRRGLEKNPPTEWASQLLFEVGQTQYQIAKNKLDSGAGMDVVEPILQEALGTFESVTETYPSTKRAPSAWYMAGSTHALLDQPEKALAAYQTTLDRYPDYVGRSRALLRCGMVLAGLDRVPESLAAFRRIAREHPDRKSEIQHASKYLHQLEIVGRKATPLYANGWLNNLVDEAGLNAFEGEVIVLVFMATWCSSCSDAIPHMRRLISTWSSQGVVFLGALNPKDPMNIGTVEDYIQRSGMEFLDIALIEDQRAWDAYHTDRLPAAVVIDRRGIIRWRGHPELFPSALVKKALRGQ